MTVEPNLWDLHHHTAADWRRILAGRPEAAVGWITFAAERGFKAAQLVLGQMYLDGHGVARDAGAAHRWFARAARIGSAEACNMLGRCHEYGWGTPVDPIAALDHYARAAERGVAWAHYNLGCLRLYGDVPRDHAEAFARFEAAAAGTDPSACSKALGMLGRCHEEGWGTSVDLAVAVRCYRAAAASGDCWSAFNLGLIALESDDRATAEVYFERALALSLPNGQAVIAWALAGRNTWTGADASVQAPILEEPGERRLARYGPGDSSRGRYADPARCTQTMSGRTLKFFLVIGSCMRRWRQN